MLPPPGPEPPLPRLRRRDTVRLADGRVMWLRPIHPRDAGPIAGAFGLLDEEEIRRRYLHPVKVLSPEYLAALVAPPPGRAYAVVAAEPLPPGEALVGAVARLMRDDEGDGAEFAILVSHFIAGQGIGTALMRKLFAWARRAGVGRIRGEMLADNVPMIRLAQAFGFEREPSGRSPGLVRVSTKVPGAGRRRT